MHNVKELRSIIHTLNAFNAIRFLQSIEFTFIGTVGSCDLRELNAFSLIIWVGFSVTF